MTGTTFTLRDREAPRLFGTVAAESGVVQIVYLGGLGDDNGHVALSPHLRSRHEVGQELRAGGVLVTEFRAANIVGSGSVSFEMMPVSHGASTRDDRAEVGAHALPADRRP